MSHFHVARARLAALVGGYEVFQTLHYRTFRRRSFKRLLLPTALSARLAQQNAGPVVERANAALRAQHFELPIAAGHRPRLDAVGKAQLIGRVRIKSDMASAKILIARQQLAAHGFYRRVADQVRHRVD